MKDYVVRIARLGDILIRAASAEEVASMAMQFDSDSWDTTLRFTPRSPAMNRIGTQKQRRKKRKAKKWGPLCLDDEIPF